MARSRRDHVRRLHPRLPGDTKESILRDIEIIKRELPIDILEFFFLTPLPAPRTTRCSRRKGIWMDPDLNKYDLNHRVSHHPRCRIPNGRRRIARPGRSTTRPSMSHDREARRGQSQRPGKRHAMHIDDPLVPLLMIRFEGAASAGGRRPSPPNSGATVAAACPIESRLAFYPRYLERKRRGSYWRLWLIYRDAPKRTLKAVLAAPDRWNYTDTAFSRGRGRCTEEPLDLYHATAGGEAVLANKRRGEAIRAGAHGDDVPVVPAQELEPIELPKVDSPASSPAI